LRAALAALAALAARAALEGEIPEEMAEAQA